MAEPVSARMIRNVITLSPDDALRTVVELELQKKIRHFPVVDAAGKLLGIVTDRDLKRALPSPLVAIDEDERERILDETKVSRIMTRDPVSVGPGTPIAEAVRLLLQKRVTGLPVVENGKLCGIFTAVDALNALLEKLDAEG